MKKSILRRPAGAVFVAFFLIGAALILASCQKPTCSACNFSALNSSNSIPNGTPVGTFMVAPNAALNPFNLGTTQTFSVTITADSRYSGTVDLNVNEAELSAIDKGLSITFSFNPSHVTLTPNQSATSVVTVTVPTLAPDFAGSLFHLVGTDSAGTYMTSTPENISVNAVFNVFLNNPTGKAPESWSVPAGSTVQFVNHPGGLVVNFENLDEDAADGPHRIFSSAAPGTILVEPSDLAASLDGLNPNPTGGTYSQTVTAQAPASDQIYCDNDETVANARIFMFNVPVVLPSPTPVASPSPSPSPSPAVATFTQVNTDIIQASCIGCHGPSYAATGGGVNLQNYTAILSDGIVVPNNASASAIYIAVSGNPPSMPEGGTPLTPTLLQELSSWINSGAPNN